MKFLFRISYRQKNQIRLSNILIRIDNYRETRSSNNIEWFFCKMPKYIEKLCEELGLILPDKRKDTF